jgi:uncharacterized metal-binding protein YceD (DUF177 family)
MPLLVNIQHLLRHPVVLKGELAVEELDYAVNDEMVQPRSPLHYSLEVEKLEDAVLAQGRLMLKLDCQCVRCLKPFAIAVDLPNWACHLPLTGDDAVPVVNDSVDLTPHIREDTLLGFPHHPVCDAECGGLKIASRGQSEKTSQTEADLPSSAWLELDKLKLK